jgi:hypothetical protein
MTLHPTAVVRHVMDEYRSYLLTAFRARDPKLRAALEEALDQPLFLPRRRTTRLIGLIGRSGRAWGDLGLDARLAKVMAESSDSL